MVRGEALIEGNFFGGSGTALYEVSENARIRGVLDSSSATGRLSPDADGLDYVSRTSIRGNALVGAVIGATGRDSILITGGAVENVFSGPGSDSRREEGDYILLENAYIGPVTGASPDLSAGGLFSAVRGDDSSSGRPDELAYPVYGDSGRPLPGVVAGSAAGDTIVVKGLRSSPFVGDSSGVGSLLHRGRRQRLSEDLGADDGFGSERRLGRSQSRLADGFVRG